MSVINPISETDHECGHGCCNMMPWRGCEHCLPPVKDDDVGYQLPRSNGTLEYRDRTTHELLEVWQLASTGFEGRRWIQIA